MTSLLLVRHAAPEIDRSVASSAWPLSEAGRAMAERLAEELAGRRIGRVVSSDEQKAVETATPIAARHGLDLVADQGLREVRRPWLDDPAAFVETVERWLTGRETGGWEWFDQVVRRWSDSIEAATDGVSGVAVVVGHGTAMSAWWSRRTGGDPVAFWHSLAMPCVVEVG